MFEQKHNKKLNHDLCRFSTGASYEVTAGQGELDYWGYFEYPCKKCAKEMELKLQSKRESNHV